MSDPRVARLAEVLVRYSAEVQPGELVLVEAPAFARPLVLELCRQVLRAGGHPHTWIGLEGEEELTLLEGSDEQAEWVNPVRERQLDACDVRIAAYATWNTRGLSGVDPARQARHNAALQPIAQRFYERAARGEVRWSLAGYPSRAAAQDAGMSLADYEDFVYRAALLHDEDPIARWREFSARLERVADFLGTHRELRIVGDATDLTVGVGGRRWVASGGRENFPDGEVFTGPEETRVDGTIRFTFPAVFQGHEVTDVRLRFERGEVVEATAARGEAFLREMIAMDDGARRVGEFAFGLNDGIDVFTKNLLFDEKLGGTVHLALGASYPETGGTNLSGLHWDMICDLRSGGEVYADGELVYRDGAFLDGVPG